MSEIKRNLRADLALCDAATAGPWYYDFVDKDNETIFAYDGNELVGILWPSDADARFIAEARTGWPDAIRRAIEAEDSVRAHDRACRREMRRLEAEVERLRAALQRVEDYVEDSYGLIIVQEALKCRE